MSGHKRYYTMKEVAEFVELPVEQTEALVRQSGLFTASRSGLKYFYQHADLLAIRRFVLQHQESFKEQTVSQPSSRASEPVEKDPFGLLTSAQTDNRDDLSSQEPDFVDVLGMIADDFPQTSAGSEVELNRLMDQETNENTYVSNGSYPRYSAAVEPAFKYHDAENVESVEAAHYINELNESNDETHDEVLSLPSKWVGSNTVQGTFISDRDSSAVVQSLREQIQRLQQEYQSSRQRERESLRQEILSIAALLRN